MVDVNDCNSATNNRSDSFGSPTNPTIDQERAKITDLHLVRMVAEVQNPRKWYFYTDMVEWITDRRKELTRLDCSLTPVSCYIWYSTRVQYHYPKDIISFICYNHQIPPLPCPRLRTKRKIIVSMLTVERTLGGITKVALIVTSIIKCRPQLP